MYAILQASCSFVSVYQVQMVLTVVDQRVLRSIEPCRVGGKALLTLAVSPFSTHPFRDTVGGHHCPHTVLRKPGSHRISRDFTHPTGPFSEPSFFAKQGGHTHGTLLIRKYLVEIFRRMQGSAIVENIRLEFSSWGCVKSRVVRSSAA